MSGSLFKRWVCVLLKTYLGLFSLNGLLTIFIGNEGIYIVWVKGKIVTLKNPPGIMFHEYLVGRPYPRDTRETDSLARLFSFQSCVSHVATSQVSFSRNPLDLQLSLSLHQLNTKPNTIKSYKIQGTKLKKLQHFLLWIKPT